MLGDVLVQFFGPAQAAKARDLQQALLAVPLVSDVSKALSRRMSLHTIVYTGTSTTHTYTYMYINIYVYIYIDVPGYRYSLAIHIYIYINK